MAANLQGVRSIGSGIGRRVVNHIRAAAVSARRGLQASAYDKNLDKLVEDDQVRATTVPDDVILPESDKYWGPNPKTGVFGPAEQNDIVGNQVSVPTPGNGDSALDQTAWFRPLEDVEKPKEDVENPTP